MIPEPPPAPLYPEHGDLFDDDVYITTMEGIDIYWGPSDEFGNYEPAMVLMYSDTAMAEWSPGKTWFNGHEIPESVKRFAESIYRLHV